jgi:Fe-S oxidoreductase
MYGPELVQAFRDFKAIWDPAARMNPGKVVNAFPLDSNLRLGTEFDPPIQRTQFEFIDDQSSFARAVQRCVGVGECRKLDGGTMCPSYMVTREEEHSTRGRARLLFEMLRGNPLSNGWRDEHVKEALDLCLSCKGCKGDCPVNVDMATYKSEFLSHYYAGRLRPRHAYAFGLIMYWARLAEHAPSLVNFATHAPGLSSVAKAIAGMAPQRRVPAFANQTFKQWFAARRAPRTGDSDVLLWPDTFNDHFHPGTARAAVEVLEAAGFRVHVPSKWLCCGRPLYDYGMLKLARRHLRQILKVLHDPIRSGMPIVVLEPSCASVFRDELLNLFPRDENARRLRQQTFLLSEFLEQKAPDFHPPKLNQAAVVQGHCHHKAIMKMDAEEAVLKRVGVDAKVLDSGCCGMAGAFGFEPGEHYAVSVKAGERLLLPAVREAPRETLVIADGFSCREQIAQSTGRRGLHLAEVLQMALHSGH